jgi:hypothetical protein
VSPALDWFTDVLEMLARTEPEFTDAEMALLARVCQHLARDMDEKQHVASSPV